MNRLRVERHARRLSQTHVAIAVQIPQTHVSAIERGTLVPSADVLARLAAVFGLTPDDLTEQAR